MNEENMAETTPRKVEIPVDYAVREHRSLWGDAWRRLISLNTARLGLVIMSILVLVGVLAPIVHDYDPTIDSDLKLRLKPPSREHVLGTDNLRDRKSVV